MSAAPRPWERPAFFWRETPQAEVDRRRFRELVAARELLFDLEPGDRRFGSTYRKLKELAKQLRITRWTGGVGQDSSPSPSCGCPAHWGRVNEQGRCTMCCRVRRG